MHDHKTASWQFQGGRERELLQQLALAARPFSDRVVVPAHSQNFSFSWSQPSQHRRATDISGVDGQITRLDTFSYPWIQKAVGVRNNGHSNRTLQAFFHLIDPAALSCLSR